MTRRYQHRSYHSLGLDLMYDKRDWTPEDLPEYVTLCNWCGGQGRYEQTYTAGCGMGHYRSSGQCGSCNGMGLNYAHGDEVPVSTIRQILNARKDG